MLKHILLNVWNCLNNKCHFIFQILVKHVEMKISGKVHAVMKWWYLWNCKTPIGCLLEQFDVHTPFHTFFHEHVVIMDKVGGGDGETNAPAISIFWGEQIHTGLGPGHHGQTARKPFQQFMKGVSSKKTYHLPWWHWIFPNRREISMNNAHRARAFFKTLDSKQIPWLHKMCHWFLYHILLTKFIFNFW